jgi:hypothetical protein
VERDQLNASLLSGATEMARGVRYLRKVKQQLDLILIEASAKDLVDGGKALNDKMDAWIENILQKELRTQQNYYQFEARLLVKYKILLNDMGDGNVPVTQGTKDVTKDYIGKWQKLRAELEKIISDDINNFSKLLKGAGLPEFIYPKPDNPIIKGKN